ncbi:ABC transporter ATP-binding protein [Mesonia maritima]|uniref:ABC-type Fe3+/spermidine/putrescine transport system ATPase subunit n=1 Tax=Mesonia maritima TaxID=1793873 RepID=A0ABU1K2B8_9FLAO|nr:ABC transporter ATP-binding protein [Mesonia maritima]MDR6299749.1 ABC-type Fe3+/spermidine/putrescine transport system ATPase subunit [Mesonia maritima]
MLQVLNISFGYSQKTTLHHIDFSIKKGEHACIIGESGCGKSTLLKAIYGLLDLDEGEILWQNEKVLGPAFNLVPGHQKMKYLAQEFDLMPFTSVKENIEKFLSRQHQNKNNKRTKELLEVIDMKAFADKKVKLLSGGQKQRVALAQVLAKEPELLLLDEPFNFIDNFRKNKLRRNLFTYLKKQKISCIFATHDSTDMLAFSDKTLVMKNGKIVAENTPEKLYDFPPSYYVASLFNEVNALEAQLFGIEKGTVLIYPSEIKVAKKGLKASVKKTYFNGNNYFIEAILEKNEEKILFTHQEFISAKPSVYLDISKELIKKRRV